MALQCGLSVLALADHDTMAGVGEAQLAASGTDLEVVPAVEINAAGGKGPLHILGYYVEPEGSPLHELLRQMREARDRRARHTVERLRDLGVELDLGRVQDLADGSIGRPHLARALVERGYASTMQEAFDRFVGRGAAAYVPRRRLTPRETIEAIGQAGGVAVLAHPAHSGSAVVARIPEFVGYGLRGVEVFYPHHTPQQVDRLLSLCREYGLLTTGGSDFHGPESGEGALLGSVHVPLACIERLREAAGLSGALG